MTQARLLVVTAMAVAWGVTAAGAASPDHALTEAIKGGSLEAVASLIAQGVDVNARAEDGSAALHWAVHLSDLPATETLLRAGADPNLETSRRVPPLYLVCENGNSALIEALLNAGADPSAAASGEPVVLTAARAGNADAVKRLIAKGASADVRETWRGQTALMWAASENYADVIRVLIESGADVSAHSLAGYNALLFAARENALDAAAALVDAGADVNETFEGTSLLTIAIINLNYEMAAFLASRGANVNVAGGGGSTPLHALVLARNRTTGGLGTSAARRIPRGQITSSQLMTLLIESGANVDARREPTPSQTNQTPTLSDGRLDLGGATPFLLAAKAADVDAMRLLLAHGADPGPATFGGTTPLMVAAGLGYNESADAGMKTERAILDAMRLTIELGHDVNAVNEFDQTALHGAVYRGMNGLIQFLVDRGAALDPKDALGRTPRELAQEGLGRGQIHRDEQSSFLLELGAVSE